MQQSHRALLEARAGRALASLYHAATPAYPRDFGPYADDFDSWLGEVGSFEIDHINGGGAYGRDFAATLAAPCNAGKLKSEAARRYYVAKGLRSMALDRAKGGRSERITEFGQLYTWGRGGRTVAPDGLIHERGGSSFSMDADKLREMTAADLTDAVQVVEAFADHVTEWNALVPENWAYETAQRASNDRGEARHILTSAREALKAIFADVRKVRAAGVETPAICQALAADVRGIRREMRAAFATLAKLAGVQALDGVAA